MERKRQESRASGILDPEDQVVAQGLFDYVLGHGGEVRDTSDGLTIVTLTGRRKRNPSMEVFRQSSVVGEVTLKLTRGRIFWQDNGSEGLAGIFMEASKVEPDHFHPSAEQRDRILREAARHFLPSIPELTSLDIL